jgi:hypothetical protein
MSLDRAQGDRRCVAAILNEKRINMVLDVDATGVNSRSGYATLDYTGRIVSFEPFAGAHQKLREIAAQDSQWKVAPRMALHVAGNSASSSVLPMLALHKKAAP